MFLSLNKFIMAQLAKGGSGSGNFSHGGRPGEIGGSGEGGQRSIDSVNATTDSMVARLKTEAITIDKQVPHTGKSAGVYKGTMSIGSVIWREQEGMKPVSMQKDIVRREAASYEVDRLLGVNMVPPTAMREVDGKPGVVQGYAGAIDPRDSMTKGATLSKISDEDIAKAAMFDYVTNQRDRYLGNFRVTEKASGEYRLRLMDNNLAFGHEKDSLQAHTFLHEALARNVDISSSTRQGLSEITKDTWDTRLSSMLTEPERQESWDRLQNIVRGKSVADTIRNSPVPNFKFYKGEK